MISLATGSPARAANATIFVSISSIIFREGQKPTVWLLFSFSDTIDFASWAIPPPLQNPSKEPAFPKPTGPVFASLICPTSPPRSFVPLYNLPFKISQEPSPVPKVRKIIFDVHFPAPINHSARANVLESFCIAVSTPNSSLNIFTTGTLSHPGKFGGEYIKPFFESRGPPQLIPIRFRL